ncbi:MAG: nicotinate (nicotinamide) nucleotide adenylyltransferase [Thermoanaerobaculia bacterium]|nr:nicotinate (nicotinamide) nucleotide adenylyltransferase [Thermoanaerobaculia bacterium]
MRVGLFGGSFDPVHRGHLAPVRRARRDLDLDRVVYLPTADPPHKSERRAPAANRFAMVELALLDEEGLVASPFELTPGEAAYTVDTIEHFERETGADLVLLIGADSWHRITEWRRWRDIVERVEIGVLARPGEAGRASDPAAELVRAVEAGRVHFLSNPPIDVSSTELRRLLARGEEPPDGAMPDLVLKYLAKYPDLYA